MGLRGFLRAAPERLSGSVKRSGRIVGDSENTRRSDVLELLASR